jgi:hypothetical protein
MANDATFKVLYNGPADESSINAATYAGATTQDGTNTIIVGMSNGSNIKIVQVTITA